MHVVTKKKCTAKIVSNSKSTPAPAYIGVWNYYKFTTPKVEKFFFAQTTLNVVSKDPVASGSTNSLQTKNDLQSRPCGLSKLVPTSLVQRSVSLRTPAFSSLKKSALRPLASSTHPLLHSTFLEWTFLPTQTRILLPGSPRLQDGLPPHHQQNKCR